MTHTELVGRDDELALLHAALRLARGGQARVAVVEGAAGIGKTALLQRFAAECGSDAQVVVATGDATESALPYGLLDCLLDTTDRWPDPFAAGAAALEHFTDKTVERPLVLILDDAHFADLPSLVALNFMVRRLRSDPLLLVLAARPQRPSRLPASVTRLAEEQQAMLTVAGLSDSAVLSLAKSLGVGISYRAAARLRSWTGGNPLHLKALLTELPADTFESLEGGVAAPRTLAEVVIRELSSTSSDARQVAAAAAVLGDRAEMTDVIKLVELTPLAVLDAVDELRDAGLLRGRHESDQLIFDHPLVRAAVYGDIRRDTRNRLHLKAVSLHDGMTALQHRVAASPGADEDLATDLEREARKQRRSGNITASAEAMLSASRVSPEPEKAEQRLARGVDLLLVSGDVSAAQAQATRLRNAEDSARGLAVLARLAWMGGSLSEASDLGLRAWQRCDELEPDERDSLAVLLATIEVLHSRGEQAAQWAEIALSSGHLDQAVASQTRAARALGLATAGDLAQGLETLSELPTDPADVALAQHPELTMRGLLHTWEGWFARAEADLSVAGSATHGDLLPHRLNAMAALAITHFRTGHWQLADAIAAQMLALAADMEQYWVIGFLHATASQVPAARGDWDIAAVHVEAANAAAARFADRATAAYADEAAIFLAISKGDSAQVVARAARLQSTEISAPERELGMFSWPVHLMTALIDLGRIDEADDLLTMFKRQARPEDPRSGPALTRLAGQVAAARRNNTAARRCFEAAIHQGGECVDVLEKAFAAETYGRFLRRRGERRTAIAHLTRAHDRYLNLGALPFADRCQVELRATGASISSSHDPIAQLTPQEHAVATLVCSGLTSRQVAAEMVLSTRTVEYHLANIYKKLSVHSRLQLAEALRP